MLEQKFRQWEQEFIQKGILAGREEGITIGEARGIINQKNTLFEMLGVRFGEIPAIWKTKINALTDSAVLNQLAIAILKAIRQKSMR